MFEAIRNRVHKQEQGFTLIELMVVVLIIAILIAIAIPTFLGARSRAQDKQAQSNLRNALTAEKTYYTDNQAYTTTVTNLTPIESSLDFTSTDASARGVKPQSVFAVNSSAGQAMCMESDSKSGTNFFLVDIAVTGGANNAGTWYGKSPTVTACPTSDAALTGWTQAGW